MRITILLILTLFIFSCTGNDRSPAKEDKKTFAEYFHFEPTADVKNFYYFPDETGIDASYWISFNCEEKTLQIIIDTLNLKQEKRTNDGLIGGLNIYPEPWWDTAYIKKTKPYSWQKENLYRYLWYDTLKKKVYFLAFDT